ncbi:MAG: hypothetical protein HY610_03190, partial [Elusimicrobia bacterium]|nr:hypothetical protein [Elusimicrobiota bacterium]
MESSLPIKEQAYKTLTTLLGVALLFCAVPSPSHSIPQNDNFANARNINLSTQSVSGGYAFTHSTGTADATVEIGTEPTPTCGYIYNRTVWYKYISTTTMGLAADTFGSSYDTVIQLYQAGSPENDLQRLVPDSCNNDFTATNQNSSIYANLAKNTTYFFQVGSHSNSPGGNLIFSSTFTPFASDDAAPTIRITDPQQGTYPILTSLSVIRGTATDNIAVSGVRLVVSSGGINGEGAGALYWDGYTWSGAPTTLLPYLKFPYSTSSEWEYYQTPRLENGTIYYLRAYATDSNNNNSSIALSSFTFNAPQINHDDYSSPIVINTLPFTNTSTTTGANYSIQKNPSCNYSYSANRDVWYRYVSSAMAAVEANTYGSNYNTILAVWQSTGGTNPIPGDLASEMECDHPYSPSAYTKFQTFPGATYYIQIMSDYGSGGTLQFEFKRLSTDNVSPNSVTDLTAAPDVSFGAIQLQWTSPGDDGAAGTASSYDIRYSTRGAINSAADFVLATPVTSSPTFVGTYPNDSLTTPQVAGTVQTQIVRNLPARTTTWWAIQAQDDAFNSSLSNSATTQVLGAAESAANISPQTAVGISVIPFSDEVNTTGLNATLESQPTCGSYKSYTANDVWYRFLSTNNVNLVANTFNSTFDTILQVWRGSAPAVFQNVACSDDERGFGTQSRAYLKLDSGTTYFFQIIGGYNAQGTLRFQLAGLDDSKPGQITSLSANSGGSNDPSGSVNLSWIEPADDGNSSSSGRVSKYHIRYSSTTSINSANWSRPFTSVGQVLDIEASPVQQTPPTPGDPGRLQTYLIKNLTPNLTYWFSVRAQDDAGNLSDTSNSPFVAAKPFIVRAGDGGGSASLFNESNNASLNSVPVSSQVTLNLRFTVGNSSITGGGKISVRIPDFWSFPQLTSSGTFGFVSLSTITPTIDLRSLSLSMDSTDPQVVVASVSTQGKLNAGDVISFRYSSITPYQRQDGVNFTVRSQGSSSGFLALISSQPRVNISGGNATFIQIKSLNSERGTIAISRNQSSPGILVEPLDNSYQRTAAHKDLNLRVFTLAYSTNSSFEYDSDGEVSDNNFISTLPALTISTRAFSAAGSYSNLGLVRSATCYIFTIPNGSTGKNIFYKTNATGDTALWLEWNDDFNVGSTTRTTATGFKVIST